MAQAARVKDWSSRIAERYKKYYFKIKGYNCKSSKLIFSVDFPVIHKEPVDLFSHFDITFDIVEFPFNYTSHIVFITIYDYNEVYVHWNKKNTQLKGRNCYVHSDKNLNR